MTYKITIGSVSHGTLKTDDLLSALSDELNRIETDNDLVAEAQSVLTLQRAGWSGIVDSEEASELVTDIVDALNEHAPSCTYFGAREGDGSDYGFWPDMEAVNELPRVNDPADVENHLGEPCVYVNDHGNVTVYAADGSVIWDCV